MSIYSTLWILKFPKSGDSWDDPLEFVEVIAQGVPAHIGSNSELGDEFAEFLPPPVETDGQGEAPFMRAVVFVTEHTVKGTERNGQEYVAPLLTLSGEEYAGMTFSELHERLCRRLGQNEEA